MASAAPGDRWGRGTDPRARRVSRIRPAQDGGDQAPLSYELPPRIYCRRSSIMAVQGIRRLAVEGGHGMDPSAVFHEYGRVGVLEGRIVGLRRLGVGRTAAG